VSDLCKWLHEQLEQLPLVAFPFALESLPQNGTYFVYERGETWGHGGSVPRIVRIGGHTGQGNFPRRINDHYLADDMAMDFGRNSRKPADASIFRKNIGRVLLDLDGDPYLDIWDIDFTYNDKRESSGHRRNIDKEKRLESEITAILRQTTSFRFIVVDDQDERRELEKHMIGTVAQCAVCTPSENWMGRHSPKPKIAGGKLWQERQLTAGPIDLGDQEGILNAIGRTKRWIAGSACGQTLR